MVPGFNINVTVTLTPFTVTSTGKGILRMLNGVPFFVNNEAEAAVLMKERQPIVPSVLIPALAAVVIFFSRIRT